MPLWYNDNLHDYLTWCEKNCDKWASVTVGECRATPVDILKLARNGDPQYVTQAETYLAQLAVNFESRGYAWRSSPCGAFPSVPDYLSGNPTCMRQRTKVIRDTAPLRIFIGATLNAGCTREKYLLRGCMLTALIMTLQCIRPVSLYLWEDSCGHAGAPSTPYPTNDDGAFITVVNIGTQPINLSQLAYLLCDSNFARGIMYGAVQTKDPLSYGYSYPPNYLNATRDYDPTTAVANDYAYIKWLRRYIGAEDTDIFIPSVHTNQMLDNPVDWLTRMLHKIVPEWQE